MRDTRRENENVMLMKLASEDLIGEIKNLFQTERKITRDILDRINEVERRRLYAERGFSSLFEWLTKEIGYSHPAAQRRIQAARLLREVPEAKAKLESGELNLTTLCKVQTVIQAEEKRIGQKLPVAQKAELVRKIENQTSLQTEALLAEALPDAQPSQERTRAIGHGKIQRTLVFTPEQEATIERARELTSHSHFNASLAELFTLFADEYIDRKDPLRKPKASERKQLESRDARSTPDRRSHKVQRRLHLVAISLDHKRHCPYDAKRCRSGNENCDRRSELKSRHEPQRFRIRRGNEEGKRDVRSSRADTNHDDGEHIGRAKVVLTGHRSFRQADGNVGRTKDFITAE